MLGSYAAPVLIFGAISTGGTGLWAGARLHKASATLFAALSEQICLLCQNVRAGFRGY